MASRFVHFKCKFDPAWDYYKIGKDFFGENKALIVAEKLNTISHVHFQGHTDLDQKQILEKINAPALNFRGI